MKLSKPKVPFWLDDTITVYAELYKGDVFLHCDMQVPWNKESKAKVLEMMRSINSTHPEVYTYVTNPKLRKFCSLIGFKFYKHLVETEDSMHEIWRYK